MTMPVPRRGTAPVTDRSSPPGVGRGDALYQRLDTIQQQIRPSRQVADDILGCPCSLGHLEPGIFRHTGQQLAHFGAGSPDAS